ncbi:MAG: tyrosine-type recombinase/integrase [Mycobacterium sp.]|uniref:tyrosine-type recombinase/integrase n=1 Tax=Mycobacterium sp. TaxID=1785 RepID=UPI003F95B400
MAGPSFSSATPAPGCWTATARHHGDTLSPNPAIPVAADRPEPRQLEERFTAGAQWRNTGLVFTTASGGFLEPRNINRMFHSPCARAEVPQLRVHDLRHSGATLLFTMGVPPATVQRILRHSSITVTTGTYVGATRTAI